MVTEATKDAVWSGYLDAARDARYYAVLADKHLKRKYWREGVTAVAGALATASVVFPTLNFLVAFAGGLLIIVVILEKFWPNQATLLSSVDVDLSSLATKYERLFREANSDQIAESTVKYAQRLLDESIEKACARVDISFDATLRDNVQAQAFEVEGDKLVQTTG